MVQRILIAAAALAVATFVVACGDNYDDASPTPARTPTSTAAAATGGTAAAGTAAAGTVSTAVSGTPSIGDTPAPPPSPAPSATPVTLPDVGTGIAGLVLIGPQCPVVQEGVECPDKPFEATIEIYAGTRLVTTVRSNADGIFVVALDPGTYRLVPLSPGGPTNAAEQTVTVSGGVTTRVTVNYDSGIR